MSKSIRILRDRHNMTQEQFGKIAGVSAMAVSQWENGRAVPRMGSIQKLSDFFNIPKSEIIGDVPDASDIRAIAEFDAAAYGLFSADERELVYLFRRMDAVNQQKFLDLAGTFVVASEKDGDGVLADVERVGESVR